MTLVRSWRPLASRDELFGHALAAQVVTGRGDIGRQGAHMQQMRHTRLPAGCDEVLHSVDVRALEIGAVVAPAR